MKRTSNGTRVAKPDLRQREETELSDETVETV
jgi:hypothetical protein